jgi:hypothetical protein
VPLTPINIESNRFFTINTNLAEGLKPNVTEGAKHKVKAAEKEA